MESAITSIHRLHLIRPSTVRGFYDGYYLVARKSTVDLRPELEKIRVAAETQWQNRVITFAELLRWVRNGAEDPLTQESTIEVISGAEQDKTVLLIKNGVFDRHF
ncbi:MAG: hypothetical protein OXH84_01660 [Gammaproteobacteria bacterium]|nr:hypothetical protein [Gammaproteobacteria bacterium]